MLRREDYLIQYEALADRDSWRGAVTEAGWPWVERHADNVLGLILDPLHGEAFIDRRERCPIPSSKRPRLQRRAANLLTVDFSNQDRSVQPSSGRRPEPGLGGGRVQFHGGVRQHLLVAERGAELKSMPPLAVVSARTLIGLPLNVSSA